LFEGRDFKIANISYQEIKINDVAVLPCFFKVTGHLKWQMYQIIN